MLFCNIMMHYLPEELAQIRHLPAHVSIIMDGNRRWAKKRGVLSGGHWEGAETVDLIVEAAAEMGVEVLTLYAFSTENWKRSTIEVITLQKILETFLQKKCDKMVKNGIQFDVIGDVSAFPARIGLEIERVKKKTLEGNRLQLRLALNYGGRDEICRAANQVGEKMVRGEIKKVTEEIFESHLDTAGLKPLDLFIRTGGEMRVSNFLLWQLSYAEIYVTDTLWPDFTPKDLLKAVLNYEKRERRIGK